MKKTIFKSFNFLGARSSGPALGSPPQSCVNSAGLSCLPVFFVWVRIFPTKWYNQQLVLFGHSSHELVTIIPK